MTLVAATQQDARSLDMLEVESIKLTIRTAIEPQGSLGHIAIGTLGDAFSVFGDKTHIDHRLGTCQECKIAQLAPTHKQGFLVVQISQSEDVRLRCAVRQDAGTRGIGLHLRASDADAQCRKTIFLAKK